MKRKALCILLTAVMLLSIMSLSVFADVVYNTNNSDPTFTVMGSLQGYKSGSWYLNEYGTIRCDANGTPNYSRLYCTVRLYANNSRVDSGEVNDTIVYMGSYAGTSTYPFSSGTISGLSATHLAEAADGTPFNPTPMLYLN